MKAKSPVKVSRTEIAKSLAASSSLTNGRARALLDSLITILTDYLKDGKDIELRGFAHFRVKNVPARRAHNPRTGAPVAVAARRKVSVKASPKLLSPTKSRV